MVFFTREIYLGLQPCSGWERKAARQWLRSAKLYEQYLAAMAPMLPPSVRRLCKQGLHDGVVQFAKLSGCELVLVVDTTNALSGFRGRQVRLTFHGVVGRFAVAKLVGQWWLYEEAHLRSGGRFCLSVMFDRTELDIEAEELVIELLPKQ
ncbi:DUF4085 family protein [Telmatocola sphagniphila]|uniref:DUF4085 family protein n=1 Tax=Telmatocola sphagniphila TaxID=1123043 RepID=A0A8E6BCE0_9BACT|nr:DUF4085 family protein [Telmatocola sphagniphila]QVL34593.1 DUF4085 family protein [Telmatocola sphagniphila]